jgi:EAL domain-containing protein (putative c-di-GMP-specific phosphodiesterase class I)
MTVVGRPLSLSASGGIAFHSGGGGDVDELMRCADVAMYAAKEAGRGRYELFEHEMARDFSEFLALEQEMRVALQREEFAVHYQPTVKIDTGAITGVEALLRWHTPEHGPVPPTRFIPIAETTGLIHPLGEFVLRKACSQVAAWARDRLLPASFVMWVNVSGKQLSVGGLPAIVQRAIEDAGIRPDMLGLEITENAIVDDGPTGDRTRRELRELRDQGVRIALDDFGTGFSSLGHLRSLPIDVIKVDRSFVEGVERDAKNAAITSNLASLAHALGLLALAEGVESEAELHTVRKLGCDAAQGFLFARPGSATEITELLASEPAFRFDELHDQSVAP